MKESLEGAIDKAGGILSWLIATVDAHQDLFRVVWATVAIAALAFVAWAVIRLAVAIVLKIATTVRSFRRAMSRLGRRMEKNRIFRDMKGKFMAKWKIGELGSRIDDAIFDMEMNGRLSDQEGKRLRNKIGKAIGDWQLVPRKWTKAYYRWYFLGKDEKGNVTARGYKKLSGPVKTIPGGHPKDDEPETNVVKSAFVVKLREKKAASAA